MNESFKKAIEILEYAVNNNLSITIASQNFNVGANYVSDIKRRRISNYLITKQITKLQYDKFLELYNDVKNNNSSKSNTANIDHKSHKSLENIVDTLIEDRYEDRSICWENRDDDSNKIVDYGYKIYIRDESPLTGTLTREQMESIIYHYPYVNQQSCSQLLPFINFLDFTKIIRVFNIRKTSLIPKHILEEKNEDEIAELVLKAKATSVYKKVVEQRPIFVERELKNVQKQLLELKEDRLFIDDTINKYFNNKPQSEVKSVVNDNRKVIKNNIGDNSNIAYCLFSDIHYGKKFDRPIFGRGYNKEIAHERVMEVAHKTVQYCQVYKPTKLIIGFFGDLIENFLEQGFHASQVLNQDLQQDEQIFFAVDSLKEALLYMYDNLSFVNIDMYACFGNHDRMSENRSDDKNRTPAKIAFKILQRELKEKINIYIDKSNIVNVKTGDIQLIGFHGDNSLIKRKNHELVNLYGGGNTTYHLVVSGHYHRTKIETGTNYMGISLPSLASVDDFILEDLGLNNLPGFILGRQTPNQKAFDYSYINLY